MINYFPYGKVLREFVNERAEKYLTTLHQRDEETGLDYRGARYYDSDVARFLSLDPAQAEFISWSPYNYVLGNPISLVDPTGRSAWKPDSEGNLIAESGDNATTLAKFQGISYSAALTQLKDQGYTVNAKGILDLKVGDKVNLDNVYTRSIERSTSVYTLDAALAGMSRSAARPEDDYNCWGAALTGTAGAEIVFGTGMGVGSRFDASLTSGYTPSDLSSAEFGKTAIRFADGANVVQHGAVYYGSDKSGTPYVYTKNGWELKPEVMKLTDLITKIPSYGTVNGILPGQSGYYTHP